MQATIKQNNKGSLDIKFSGRLDTLGADEITSGFYAMLENLQSNVVIDFGEVAYISSAGIRLLLSGFKIASRQGFKLYITDQHPEITAVIKMAGLEQMLLF